MFESRWASCANAWRSWWVALSVASALGGCGFTHDQPGPPESPGCSGGHGGSSEHADAAAGRPGDTKDAGADPTAADGHGGSSGMTCTNACQAGTTRCASATSLETCTVGTNGCTSFVASTCATGTVCERTTPAACVDPQWAEWPVSNSTSDVANGAPNLAQFVDNLDGTVTDRVTGLMWEQRYHQSVYDFGDVFCPTVTTGGYTDWRASTTIELVSIADFSRDQPSIDTTAFPLGDDAGFFWSSTKVDGYGLEPDIIDYGRFPAIEIAGGFGVDGQPGVNVRCVRSAGRTPAQQAPASRYVLGNDHDTFGAPDIATVYDTRTQLTWAQVASGPVSSTSPLGYCADLTNQTGVVGWRLPTTKELFTLMTFNDSGGDIPTIDTQFFPNTPAAAFVSATSSPMNPHQCVYFAGNFYFVTNCVSDFYVRCVR